MGGMDFAILSVFVLVAMAAKPALAAVYVVGDGNGWNLAVNYTQWASSYNFAIGDCVVFKFASTHSVLMVSEVDYVVCNIHSPISVVESGKPVPLLTRKNYFICGVPGHCITGMKVAIFTSLATPLPSQATSRAAASIVAIWVSWLSALGALLLILL